MYVVCSVCSEVYICVCVKELPCGVSSFLLLIDGFLVNPLARVVQQISLPAKSNPVTSLYLSLINPLPATFVRIQLLVRVSPK